jgi:hypothetical protein
MRRWALMVGRHLVRSNAASDIRPGEDDSTVRGLGSYAAGRREPGSSGSSSTAAEHHRGQREAPFRPSLKAAGKRSNMLKSTAAQLMGYPCAGELMRASWATRPTRKMPSRMLSFPHTSI